MSGLEDMEGGEAHWGAQGFEQPQKSLGRIGLKELLHVKLTFDYNYHR